MTQLHELEPDRNVHPVDIIEHIAAINDWSFERQDTDEISISVRGAWSDYHVSFNWMDPATKEHNDEAIDYDKYRDIGGGIMWPYSIERERNGYKSYQMFATNIEANQQVPPKTFDLPPGAKVLKKVD